MVNTWFCFPLRVCFLILLTTQAFALESNQANWRGFYGGVNIGGTQSNMHMQTLVVPDGTYFNYTQDAPQIYAAGKNHKSHQNFSGGLFGGYLHQFGNVVLGGEASVNSLFINHSRSVSDTFISDPTIQFVVNQSFKAHWQETLRLKMGFTQQSWLGYLIGGVAITDVKYKSTYMDSNTPPGLGLPAGFGKDTASKILFGWTLGAGAEYALNNMWSVKAEYLYSDFGNVQTKYPIIPTPTLSEFSAVMKAKANLRVQSLVLGLTYRFL